MFAGETFKTSEIVYLYLCAYGAESGSPHGVMGMSQMIGIRVDPAPCHSPSVVVKNGSSSASETDPSVYSLSREGFLQITEIPPT